MDLKKADTRQTEGKGRKPQFLCRVSGVLRFFLEDHPAYDCAPFTFPSGTRRSNCHAASWGLSFLGPSSPSSPSSHAFPSQQRERLYCPGTWTCPGQTPGQSIRLFTALVSQSSKFWEKHQKIEPACSFLAAYPTWGQRK